MEELFQHVSTHQDLFVQKLAEAVAIPSISADPHHYEDCVRMSNWLSNYLQEMGAAVRKESPGKRTLQGREIEVPPVVLASLGSDTTKPTICIYGHYDVQPAKLEDGWTVDPFVLHEDDTQRLMGRGSTDDKGPVLAWLFAIQAFQALNVPLPVNIRFIFEGTEESGSFGLESLILQESSKLFSDVDCVCISDSYWLGTRRPCLQYGLRGIATFQIEVTGAPFDVHSGIFGGAIHEPLIVLTHLLSRLVSPTGDILIPGLLDDCFTPSPEERRNYDALDYSVKDFQAMMDGAKTTKYESFSELMQATTLRPSLSLHGIEGAYSGENVKTVIPGRVLGKFSIRLVPYQKAEKIGNLVTSFLESEFSKLNSLCKMKVHTLGNAPAWESNFNDPNYVAGRKAMELVYGESPELVRCGGSIPPAITLSSVLDCNVLLLPLGASNDGAHSINEKIDRKNFIEGIKVMICYLDQVGRLQQKKKKHNC